LTQFPSRCKKPVYRRFGEPASVRLLGESNSSAGFISRDSGVVLLAGDYVDLGQDPDLRNFRDKFLKKKDQCYNNDLQTQFYHIKIYMEAMFL
jgi:hypothetical protein